MTTTQDRAPRLPTPHRTWWKAPLPASAPGLPLLAIEYGVIRAHDGMDQYGGLIYTALALFALAWLLPHRRSLRTYRGVTASLGLGVVLLSLMLLLVLAASTAGG